VDYASGQNAIGQPPSLDPINPAKNMPFGVSTAQYAFGQGGPHTPAGPGGLLGAGETALTALGAGVQPPTLTPHRDGLARLDDGALPATPITDAWANAQVANPKLGDLALPNRNVTPKIALDDKELDSLRVFTGTARQTVMAQVISSPKYQNADPLTQEKILVGAKAEADREAKVSFALDHAQQATDDMGRVRAVTIGYSASPSNAAKMDLVSKLQQSGALTETVHSAIDDMRKQSDPLKGKYEPSVAEFIKGNDLVQKYLAAPAYRGNSTPQDWADAAKQGAALRATYQSLEREAVQKSTATHKVSIDQLPHYQNYKNDYATARTASNIPVSAFVTFTGEANPKLVSVQRLQIKADPLFKQFFQSIAKSRDPYSIKTAP
jgi:hypothetical protein